MKKNKGNGRIVMLAIIIIAVIAVIVMLGNKGKTEENVAEKNASNNNDVTSVAENNGEKVISEVKKYKGLEISNINLKVDDEMMSVTADVYNPTSSKVEEQSININAVDANGNVITKFTGIIDAIEPGEKRQISSAIVAKAEDKNACNIEITEVEAVTPAPEDNTEPQE